MAFVLKLVLVLGLFYAVLVIAAYFLQRRLMYFPDRQRVAPVAEGLAGVDEVEIETGDGQRVLAWWSAPEPGKATLLYFHGNAGSLATRSERFRIYQGRGLGVLMMTYRGYGGSTGQPSERANVADAKTAYRWLRDKGVSAADIILYGESIGTGVAVQVAVEHSVAGIILDAPYTSMVALAELHYPYLPARYFMSDRYETEARIRHLTCPILVIHGEDDRLVPLAMGRELFAAAPEPKKMVTFPEAGHSDHHLFGSYDAIFAWIETLRDKQEWGRRSPMRHRAAE